MATTISAVTNRDYDVENTKLLRKTCDQVAANGGSFSIVTRYDGVNTGAMVTTFTINWPDKK